MNPILWMATEEWRPVSGYVGAYEVSNLGRVRSVTRISTEGSRPPHQHVGRVLRGCLDRGGYLYVSLCRAGTVRTMRVHRLVATAFLGHPPDGTEVDHINSVRTDNRASNLRWLSRRENILRGVGPTAAQARQTNCKRGHDLSSARLSQRGERVCRRCKTDLERARRAMVAEPVAEEASRGR